MRRGNGEGSIFKLSGKRRRPFAVRITVGYSEDGKQKYKYLGYYAKITEAKTALREYLANPFDLTTKDVTVEELFHKWKDDESSLSEKTIQNYHAVFKRCSVMYQRKIREIKYAELEKYMFETCRTPSVQKTFKNLMNQLYLYAMKHEVLDRNLSSLLKVEYIAPKEKQTYSVDEINTFWKNSEKLFYGDIPLIMLYTGLRINEVLKIKRKDVHLEDRYFIAGSKTTAGRNRVVPIHDKIFHLIEKRYNNGFEYLLTNRQNKKINDGSFRNGDWKRMTLPYGITKSPHETRHTFITWMDKSGADRVATKRIVGHTTRDITDHYSHRDVGELLEEINKLKYT